MTAGLGSMADGLNNSPRSLQLRSLADDLNAKGQTAVQRQPAPQISAGVVQRISEFSQNFIENNMLPILSKHMPDGAEQFEQIAAAHLTIDDDESAGDAAVQFVRAVTAVIPAAELRSAIAAFNESKTLLGQSVMEDETATAVITELQMSVAQFEAAQTVMDVRTIKDVRKYVKTTKADYARRGMKPKSYEDTLLSSGSDLLLNPSSGAHYLDDRDADLMPLSHGKQVKASLYHRSAKHQLFAGINAGEKSTLLSNMVVNTQGLRGAGGSGAEAHAGLYPNALTFLRNRAIKKKPIDVPDEREEQAETTPGTGEIYDQSLLYKLSLSKSVVALAGNLNFITAGVYSDYPLVMVHFDLIAFMDDYTQNKYLKPSKGTKKAFTSFLMNYYTGLVNFYAQSAGLDIAMVERSSFGFSTPSIAETGESFRINMGLMPPVYAHVQAQALQRLDDELNATTRPNGPDSPVAHKLDTKAAYFDVPVKELGKRKRQQQSMPKQTLEEKNAKRTTINAIDDWLEFALAPIEIKGRTAIANATRARTSLDYVNAQAFNNLVAQGEVKGDLKRVLASLFGYTALKGKTLSTKVPAKQTRYGKRAAATGQSFKVSKDLQTQHEALLGSIARNLAAIAQEESDALLAGQLLKLAPLLTGNNPNLETTLDLVNELLLVHAFHQTENADLADTYASDSEVEEESDLEDIQEDHFDRDESEFGGMDIDKPRKRLLAGKKIITHNGMRAAISAIDTAQKVIYPSEEKLNLHIIGAYYEMDDALKVSNVKAQKVENIEPAHALVTDINACVTDAKSSDIPSLLDNSKEGVWIIDTTSATQEQMSVLIDKFRASQAQFLYLVSSGFKQEQLGADRNQYGTIRMFTDRDNKKRIDEVRDKTMTTDKPLTATAHIYRRVMKKFGAVPRNINILKGSKGANPKQSNKQLLWQFLLDETENEYKQFNESSSQPSSEKDPMEQQFDSKSGSGEQDELGYSSSSDEYSSSEEDYDSSEQDSSEQESSEQESDRDVTKEEIVQTLYNDFIAALEDVPREQIVLNPLADNSIHPRKYIYHPEHEAKSKVAKSASAGWFDLIRNDGGGDCVLYALTGTDLTFKEVVDMRSNLAEAAGHTLPEQVTGNDMYQALYQSHVPNVETLMRGRHAIPRSVMQAMMKVPTLYAGEQEIQAFCRAEHKDAVYVVTETGQLRRITANAAATLNTVDEAGDEAFKVRVQERLDAGDIVLFKSPDHWEKVTAVKQSQIVM